MNRTTHNLCNDLNRLATVKLLSYGVDTYLGKRTNLRDWKDSFLTDVGILMVYHQVLARVTKALAADADADMVGDLVKTGCLLLVPQITNLRNADWRNADWRTIGLVLGGTIVYHKVIRSRLLQAMSKYNITFDEGIEDLTETVLLLALSRQSDWSSVISQLAAIAIAHAYLWH